MFPAANLDNRKVATLLSPAPYNHDSNIPRREFFADDAFQKGQLSLTIGAGGVGKTSLCVAEAVALAGGFSLFDQRRAEFPVWFISAEEDFDEMRRRIEAACHEGLYEKPASLFLNCVARDQIHIVDQHGVNKALVTDLITEISKNEIKIVFVDPFICTHNVSENDNVKIDLVARTWKHIATESGCAIHIIHHQAKGRNGQSKNGQEDGARGASALRDAARYVRTLFRLSPEEVTKAGLDPSGKYVRVQVTKSNYTERGTPNVIELVTHTLQNGPTQNGNPTAGDKVGAVRPQGKYNLPLSRGSQSSGQGEATVKGAPAPRSNPATEEEIDIVLQIATQGDYKKGTKNWIGIPIAKALGLDAKVDRKWLSELISILILEHRLVEVPVARTGSGVRAKILRPKI